MKTQRIIIASIIIMLGSAVCVQSATIRFKETDDVLTNPGIGFTTFQRFNGDNWAGYQDCLYRPTKTDYESFDGNLENENYPATTIAYFRILWKFIEPENGKYRWDFIDRALETARRRGQTVILRIAPSAGRINRTKYHNVPGWYLPMAGKRKESFPSKWMVDPEKPTYVQYFGRLIKALGERYDGHPDLEYVDMSLLGSAGEGSNIRLLTSKTKKALVDVYIESFKQTPLIMLVNDEETNLYGLSRTNVGWRVDCLGDLGGFGDGKWSHMTDFYPQKIINCGMRDAWKTAPVCFEACWDMQHWKDEGWDIDYIIDQSLKWHISSFNNKSMPVPKQWEPQVNRWLRKMGYRFVLRKFIYPDKVKANSKLTFTSWWENTGVAPCYRKFPVALRLRSDKKTAVLITDADITKWLPGDNLFDSSVTVPAGLPAGEYDLQIGILDLFTKEAKIKLAIEGRQPDGWYQLGKIKITK